MITMGCHMRRPLGHDDACRASPNAHRSRKDPARRAGTVFGAHALLVLFAVACERGTPAPPTPSGPPSTPTPIGQLTAVTGLVAETACSRTEPGKASAQLSWNCGPTCAEEHRVAVTIYPDGFDTGKFETSETIPPGQSSLVWNQLHGQAFHFWRVLTRRGDEWVPSETARFEGPTCATPLRRRQ